MASKCYAVRKGYGTGIFNTWSEAQKQVSGYSGAEFKSFKTREEAQDYMNGGDFNPYTGEEKILPHLSENAWTVYVDGSYNVNTKKVGSGIVYLQGDELITTSSITVPLKDTTSRNVIGELWATLTALKSCKFAKVKELYIYHDYIGVKEFVTGDQKAKSDISKFYKRKFEELSEGMIVQFRHIKAHTGDKYNELADTLAKKAVGL